MEKFNTNLKLLLEQICNVFPEQKDTIQKSYHFEECGDMYLKSFYNNCRNMGNDVSSKNEIIFSEENTILDNVDFYEIWNSDKLTDEMRNNIWKYLHTLYIYAYEYEKDEDIKTILKELKKLSNRDNLDEDSQTLLNIIDSLTGKYDKAPEGMKEDEEEETGTDNSFNNFAPPELFDGMIGDLAKEIAEEIDPKEINLDDPSKLLKDLMSGNFDINNDSSGIANLVKNITGKIQSKLESGSLNEDALFSEAQNVMKSFGKNKNFGGGQMGKMFETMMQSGMQSSMDEEEMSIFKNAQNIVNSGGTGNGQALKTQYERKQMRDKLKKKLEDKKQLLEKKEKELAEKAQMQAEYDATVDIDQLAAEIEAIGEDKKSKTKKNKSKKSNLTK
jgi:hypothetical protein